MNNLDLFNKPLKSYLIYQTILLIIGLIIITCLSLFLQFNISKAIIGFISGCLTMTIGFCIIVYSADRVLYNANNEKHAKGISLAYFTLRYFIYLFVNGIMIKLFDASILTIIIGMFSLKIIIYIDNVLQKSGGEN